MAGCRLTPLFLRNDVISRVGFYNLNYKVSADYDFVIRLFSTPNLKSLFIDFPITFMRMGGASGNAQNFYRKVWKISKLFAVIKSGGFRCLLRKKIRKLTQFKINI